MGRRVPPVFLAFLVLAGCGRQPAPTTPPRPGSATTTPTTGAKPRGYSFPSVVKPRPAGVSDAEFQQYERAVRFSQWAEIKALVVKYPDLAYTMDGGGCLLAHTLGAYGQVTKEAKAPADYLFTELKMHVHIRRPGGRTPLHDAAHAFDAQSARYLVKERGADLEAVDEQGRTPIFQASKGLVFQQLLAAAANPRVADAKGVTLYEDLTRCQAREIVPVMKAMGLDQ